MMIMKAFTLALCFLISVPSWASEKPKEEKPSKEKTSQGLEGVYVGAMQLSDAGHDYEVPLQLALTVTNEFKLVQVGPTKKEAQRVIEGSVLIDDEGGPYPFTKVTFNLDSSEIDLRANRAELTFGGVPAAFRLYGKVEDGEISGTVVSGIRGLLGTFSVSLSDQTVLIPTTKYEGIWRGTAEVGGGGRVPFAVNIASTLSMSSNPLSLEFDYTPGKIGSLFWQDTPISFSTVHIDYLRRMVYLIDGQSSGYGAASSNAECRVDFETGQMVGVLYNNRGARARFRLKQD